MAAELWGRARSRVAEHLSEDLAIPTEGIFADTDRRLLELLIRASDKRIAVPDEILINSGDRDDTLFVLLRGEVEVRKDAMPGSKPFSRVMHSPNVFGEACALGLRQVRTAEVRAVTVCDLRLIPGAQLQQIIKKFGKDKQHLHRESQARLDEQAAWMEKAKSLRVTKTWATPSESTTSPPEDSASTANSTAVPSQPSSEQVSRRPSGISCITDHLSVVSCPETPCETPRRASLVSRDLQAQAEGRNAARSPDRSMQESSRQRRARRQHTMSGSGWSYERGRLKAEAPDLPSAWMRSADALQEASSPSQSEAETPSHSVSTPRLPSLSMGNSRAASPSVERQKAVELSAAVGAMGSTGGMRGRARRRRPVKQHVADAYSDHRQPSKDSRSVSSHASSAAATGACDSWEPPRSDSHSRGFAQVQEWAALDTASAVAEANLSRQASMSSQSFGRGRPNTPVKQSSGRKATDKDEEASTERMARSASAGGRHNNGVEAAAQKSPRKGRSQLQNRHPLELVQHMHQSRGCGQKNRSAQFFSPASSPRDARPSFSSPVSPVGPSSPAGSGSDVEEDTDRVPSPCQVLTSKPRAASSRAARLMNRGPREGWQKSLCQHVAICYPSALPTKDTFAQRKVPRPVSPDASSSMPSAPDTAQGRGRQPCVESGPTSPRGEAEPDIFQTLLARHLEAGRGRRADESDSPQAPYLQAPQEILSPTRPPPQPPPGRRPVREGSAAPRGRRLSGGTSSNSSSAAVLS